MAHASRSSRATTARHWSQASDKADCVLLWASVRGARLLMPWYVLAFQKGVGDAGCVSWLTITLTGRRSWSCSHVIMMQCKLSCMLLASEARTAVREALGKETAKSCCW